MNELANADAPVLGADLKPWPPGSGHPARPAAGTGRRHPDMAEDRSWIKVLLLTTLGIATTFLVGRSGWYTAADDVGYYVGMVGGVLTLLLLAYPMRKHLKVLRRWGAVRYWFAVHMVLGICAPLLILLHSTFRLGSTNSAVALICMLVVASSGIVGRFLYTKVYRGLYGERLSLNDLQTHSGLESRPTWFGFPEAPRVAARLRLFERIAMRNDGSRLWVAWRFVSIGIRRIVTERRCRSELAHGLWQAAASHGWSRAQTRHQVRDAGQRVGELLASVQRISQFTLYERLLGLWHVAHVPLVYVLAVSSAVHVVGVYMY